MAVSVQGVQSAEAAKTVIENAEPDAYALLEKMEEFKEEDQLIKLELMQETMDIIIEA